MRNNAIAFYKEGFKDGYTTADDKRQTDLCDIWDITRILFSRNEELKGCTQKLDRIFNEIFNVPAKFRQYPKNRLYILSEFDANEVLRRMRDWTVSHAENRERKRKTKKTISIIGDERDNDV